MMNIPSMRIFCLLWSALVLRILRGTVKIEKWLDLTEKRETGSAKRVIFSVFSQSKPKRVQALA
ncbi:hypothetical protein AMTRI_Chr01g113090 [Amborella trichopoda]